MVCDEPGVNSSSFQCNVFDPTGSSSGVIEMQNKLVFIVTENAHQRIYSIQLGDVMLTMHALSKQFQRLVEPVKWCIIIGNTLVKIAIVCVST